MNSKAWVMQIHNWLHYLGLLLSLAMLIIRWLIWHFIFIYAYKGWPQIVIRLNQVYILFAPVTKKMIQRSIKVPFLVGLNSSSTEFAENFTFWNRRAMIFFTFWGSIHTISYAIRVSKAKDQLGIPCVILNHLSVKIFGAKVFSAGIHLPSWTLSGA